MSAPVYEADGHLIYRRGGDQRRIVAVYRYTVGWMPTVDATPVERAIIADRDAVENVTCRLNRAAQAADK